MELPEVLGQRVGVLGGSYEAYDRHGGDVHAIRLERLEDALRQGADAGLADAE